MGRARVDEKFLAYVVSMESLVLPRENDSELTYRLRLFTTHLIAERKPEDRDAIFKRVSRLYSRRSAIVHKGERYVTKAELAEAKGCALYAILHVLLGLNRRLKGDLDRWMHRQTLGW